MKNQIEEQVDPIAEARAIIEADRQARARACAETIVQVLKEYSCKIEADLLRQQDGTFRPFVNIEAA